MGERHGIPARRDVARRRRAATATAALAVAFGVLAAPCAHGFAGEASTAALQVALRANGLYNGSIDGLRGPGTAAATRGFQRRSGLPADGVAGPMTRRALGVRGRPGSGSRALARGMRGWDVAALQFLLARAGFPSGPVDGGLGARTDSALRRYQARAGLAADGVAGAATLAALRGPPPRCPIALGRPVQAPIGDPYGMRGTRLHAGIDFPAASGTRVSAAAAGTVATVGWDGGWGNYVVVDHGGGVRTLSAHLSSVAVAQGTPVAAGARIGAVGATGLATGPHLHFEVFSRGANVDPLPALGAA
jgi:murein DD-endopeptidase MepM/ murein hydrolase activator NlpD